jgi:hypothetical protein
MSINNNNNHGNCCIPIPITRFISIPTPPTPVVPVYAYGSNDAGRFTIVPVIGAFDLIIPIPNNLFLSGGITLNSPINTLFTVPQTAEYEINYKIAGTPLDAKDAPVSDLNYFTGIVINYTGSPPSSIFGQDYQTGLVDTGKFGSKIPLNLNVGDTVGMIIRFVNNLSAVTFQLNPEGTWLNLLKIGQN